MTCSLVGGRGTQMQTKEGRLREFSTKAQAQMQTKVQGVLSAHGLGYVVISSVSG